MTSQENPLHQLKDLIRSGELDRALELTLELRRMHPAEAKYHRMIQKIRFLLIKKEQKERKLFIARGMQTIVDLIKREDFEKAIQACNELLEVDPDHWKVHRFLKKAKLGFIELKLKNPIQKKLEETQEYEKLYLFYQKLAVVFPEYQKLRRLIKETEKKLIAQDQGRKQSFVQDNLKKLQQWFIEGRYEQVIRGANEVLAFTHQGSKEIQILLKRAEKEQLKVIEQETLDYMLKQHPILKEAYLKKEQRIVKI